MKSLFSRSICFATLLLIATRVTAQDDLRPLIDSDSEVESVLQAAETEDIPPPIPVPDAGVAIPEPRPVTGADLAPTTAGGESKAYDFGISYVSTTQGMQVRGVLVDSQAAAVGLQPNDTIVSVNGGVASYEALQQGQIESIEVIRDGMRQTLQADATTRRDSGAGVYVPNSQSAYSVPRRTSAPQSAYRVPTTTYSTPRTYRYSPSYDERYAPGYVYRSVRPSYAYPVYRDYARPRVSIGYGTGGIGPRIGGYRGFGVGGPGFGYGRYGGYGRGFGGSGFSIRIGF